jgi:hypothetical protein
MLVCSVTKKKGQSRKGFFVILKWLITLTNNWTNTLLCMKRPVVPNLPGSTVVNSTGAASLAALLCHVWSTLITAIPPGTMEMNFPAPRLIRVGRSVCMRWTDMLPHSLKEIASGSEHGMNCGVGFMTPVDPPTFTLHSVLVMPPLVPGKQLR